MKKILLLTAASLISTGALAHDIFKDNPDTIDHVLLDPNLNQMADFYGTSLAEANDQPWGVGASTGTADPELGNNSDYGNVIFETNPDLAR